MVFRLDLCCPIVSARRVLALVFVTCLATGCSSEGHDVAPVSGQITLNGTPQPDIFVYFNPQLQPGGDPMDVGVSSYGLTDEGGRFTLRLSDSDDVGAVVGMHSVRMDDKRTFGGEPDAGGGGMAMRSRIPRKWGANKVTYEVTSDGTEYANFELSD